MERENDSSISLFAPAQAPDPVEARLIADLETLLTVDIGLSDRYRVLLRDHRKTRHERRILRAELRRLHTEEGAVLLQLKLYLAKKGRGGGWAEFLRERKPKPLARTTADRWICWYLDSQRVFFQAAAVAVEAPENVPRNESGAFSGDAAHSQSPPSAAQPPVATDEPAANDCRPFEDLQQVIVLLKKSKAAHVKAAAKYAVAKLGFVTPHEAIYVTFTEAMATRGFVYPTPVAEEGETSNVNKGVNPEPETPAAGSQAA